MSKRLASFTDGIISRGHGSARDVFRNKVRRISLITQKYQEDPSEQCSHWTRPWVAHQLQGRFICGFTTIDSYEHVNQQNLPYQSYNLQTCHLRNFLIRAYVTDLLFPIIYQFSYKSLNLRNQLMSHIFFCNLTKFFHNF